MPIDLGSVSLDEQRLVKQLQNDLRDDWFPDPLRFTDMLSTDIIGRHLLENFEANQGLYVPSLRTLFNVPKPNFTLRYGLETGIPDRALYHSLTTFLIPFFDPLIPWNVYSHRENKIHPDPKFTFVPGVRAWQDFAGTAKAALSPNSWLLSTDVANCFEHVNLNLLHNRLLLLMPSVVATSKQKSLIRAHIELLFRCLKTWAYDAERGLPQNRDASSFLANIYFYPVDIAMQKHGFADTYFRYMDDVKVICNDEYSARKALNCMGLELRKLGLYLNSKKTVICPALDTETVSQCFDEGSPELQQLDELWRIKAPATITRAIPRIKQLTLDLIDARKTDTKEFRFCIHRLRNLALATDFVVPPDFFDKITPSIIRCIETSPASSAEIAQYLIAVSTRQEHLDEVAKFVCDEHKCIYNWQNYWLWILLAAKKHISLVLAARAESLINGEDTPTRAGATLYMGAVGSNAGRELIAKNFKTLSCFLGQRNALIALREVPFRPLIEGHVATYVRDDLKGVYRNLRKGAVSYFAPPERMPLLQFPEPAVES